MAPGACACGRSAPRIREVAGRAGLIFVGANGALIHGYFLEITLRTVAGVREFQLIQDDVGQLRLCVVPGAGFAPENFESFRAFVRRLLGDECRLTIEVVERIPLSPSGKALLLVSRLPAPYNPKP
jgi:phenylacetate-CoA ligase